METCSIETGMFKKKPCGSAAVTKCVTCEQPLCAQHAIAQMTAGKKTGKFLCKECDDAQKQYDKDQAKHAKEKQNADMMKSLMNPGTPKPRAAPPAGAAAPAAGAKPAAPAAGAKPGAPAPAAPKPADDAPLEFTPAAKPPATDDIPPTIEYRPEPKKK